MSKGAKPEQAMTDTVKDVVARLDDDDLETIAMCIRNGQPGRVTPYEIKAMCEELIRLRSLAGSVPDGWKLVPVEPTDEILRSVSAACRNFYDEGGPYPRSRAVYRAMLSASPTPPVASSPVAPVAGTTANNADLLAVIRTALQWHEDYRTEIQKIGPGTIPQWVMDGWAVHAAHPASQEAQPKVGGEKADWWDAAALAISEDVLGRRYKSADEFPYADARILYDIVASVEAAWINAGASSSRRTAAGVRDEHLA